MNYLSNHLAPWIDPRVRSVRVGEMTSYLQRHGWKPHPSPRAQALSFEGPPDDNGEPLQLMIPSTERGSDYTDVIIRAITSLALIEDRYAGEVLSDILNQPAEAVSSANGQEDAGRPARAPSAPR